MARPLPKDLEERIVGVARRSEVRSVGVMGFILGTAFGFGLGASFLFASLPAGMETLFFTVGAGGIAVLWFFAGRRNRDN